MVLYNEEAPRRGSDRVNLARRGPCIRTTYGPGTAPLVGAPRRTNSKSGHPFVALVHQRRVVEVANQRFLQESPAGCCMLRILFLVVAAATICSTAQRSVSAARTASAEGVRDKSTFEVEDNHQSPQKCNRPFYKWFQGVWSDTTQQVAVLDVGGGQGSLGKHARMAIKEPHRDLLHWDCIDVTQSRNCSRRCCTVFDGATLPHPNRSKDLVLFNYVLHHAADATISLLQHARRVTRRHVVVVEDLKATSNRGVLSQFHHERMGTYRGETEWRAIFKLLGFQVVYTDSPTNKCAGRALDVPRRLFVLQVAS